MGIAFRQSICPYLFYELLTIFTYPWLFTQEQEVPGQALYNLQLCRRSLVLAALVMTYTLTGTLDFTPGGIVHPAVGQAGLWRLIFVCFVIGFGVKAAIMPLHAWLPAAMVAPTPVSALLHAVAVVKSGVFSQLRVMYSVYGSEVLSVLQLSLFVIVLVSITILVASIIALSRMSSSGAWPTPRSASSAISSSGGLLTSLGLTGACCTC